MKRSPEEWRKICEKITVGYIPGGNKLNTYDTGVFLVEKSIMPSVPIPWFLGVHNIVDLGCGNGRIEMGLAELLNDHVSVLGYDIFRDSIEFCKKAFLDYPNFKFHYMNIINSHYNPKGKIYPEEMEILVPSEVTDLVIANSLFSHIAPEDAVINIMGEIKRIMKPGGYLYSTWFTVPPEEKFSRNEARVVWSEDYVLDEVIPEDFEIIRNFVPSLSIGGGQRLIVARKPSIGR